MLTFKGAYILKIFIFLTLFARFISINQQCTTNNDCPAQAFCSSSSNYCICLATYIIDCNIPATPISSTGYASSNVSQNAIYFTYQPSDLNTYMYIVIKVCQINAPQNSNDTLSTWIWIDSGNSFPLNTQTSLLNSNVLNQDSCFQLATPYIKFQSQPNGNKQLMILGVQLNTTTTTNTQQVTIQITENKLMSQQLILIIGLSILGFLLSCCFCILIICIIRWKLNRTGYQQQEGNMELKQLNNIAHFDLYMPIKKASLFPNVIGTTCSVCLSEVISQQQVRKTPCQHFFHIQCLDSWAKKNLSCPVCRQNLDKVSMAEISKRKMQNRLVEGNQNRLQEDIQKQSQTARYLRIKKQLNKIANENQPNTEPLEFFLSRQ